MKFALSTFLAAQIVCNAVFVTLHFVEAPEVPLWGGAALGAGAWAVIGACMLIINWGEN